MLASVNRSWEEAYYQAALEVDAQKMPQRIVTARQTLTGRLRELGNSEHEAEGHEIEAALTALTVLEDEARTW